MTSNSCPQHDLTSSPRYPASAGFFVPDDGHRIIALIRLAVDPDQLQFRRIASRVITPPSSGVFCSLGIEWHRGASFLCLDAHPPQDRHLSSRARDPPQKPLQAPRTRHHGNPDPNLTPSQGSPQGPPTTRQPYAHQGSRLSPQDAPRAKGMLRHRPRARGAATGRLRGRIHRPDGMTDDPPLILRAMTPATAKVCA